jgi:hypothetical protein
MWIGVLAVACILFAAFAFGAPNVGEFGLSWDNSAAIAREAGLTDRARIEANRDIKLGEQRSEAAKTIVGTLAILGGVVALGWSVQRIGVAYAARPHRPAVQPPAQIVIMAAPLLKAAPSATVAWVERPDFTGWAVVNPRTETLTPLRLTDSQRRPST